MGAHCTTCTPTLTGEQMADVTTALGGVMRHLPADEVIVHRDSVTVYVPGCIAFAHWRKAVNGLTTNRPGRLFCEGRLVDVPVFVLTSQERAS